MNRRRLSQGLLGLLVLNAVAFVVARVVSARMAQGDDSSDEIVRLVLWNGDVVKSVASAFRLARVRVVGGGMILDLRGAALDAAGATIDVAVVAGGVTIVMPDTWRVTVDADSKMGGISASLPDDDELADDAPTLRVVVRNRAGGVSIRARSV